MRPLLLLILAGFACPGLLSSADPAWWTAPATAIIDAEADPAPLAPVTVGQLKHVAQMAAAHLDDRLDGYGGAGPAIDALVAGFSRDDPANLAPSTLGQVKAVAHRFYARLLAVGYDTRANLIVRGYPSDVPYPYPFPWDPTNLALAAQAPAVQAQLKMTFSFDLASFDPEDPDLIDTDNDGVFDLAEIWLHFTDPNNASSVRSLSALDDDDDGFSRFVEWLLGQTDSTANAAGDTDGTSPVLTLANGNELVVVLPDFGLGAIAISPVLTSSAPALRLTSTP